MKELTSSKYAREAHPIRAAQRRQNVATGEARGQNGRQQQPQRGVRSYGPTGLIHARSSFHGRWQWLHSFAAPRLRFGLLVILLILPPSLFAQRGRGGGGGAPPAGRAAAPIDLTGNWVSIVTEDWRLRMVVAQKGDWDVIPLNEEGRKVAEAANLAQDEASGNQCRAYGAAGLMRIPGRLRISWENDTALRIDTDAGTQTRLFNFGPARPPSEPSLQGYSVAQWETFNPEPNIGGKVSRGGQLKVTTTQMRPGYYFKHGVPYSGNASMTEYFSRLSEANGDEYIMITTIVDDPTYLTQQFVRTLVFKREPDGTKFNPTPCSSR